MCPDGNRIGDPLVHRPAVSPLSHTSQGAIPVFSLTPLTPHPRRPLPLPSVRCMPLPAPLSALSHPNGHLSPLNGGSQEGRDKAWSIPAAPGPNKSLRHEYGVAQWEYEDAGVGWGGDGTTNGTLAQEAHISPDPGSQARSPPACPHAAFVSSFVVPAGPHWPGWAP